jgi:hypothetical protein
VPSLVAAGIVVLGIAACHSDTTKKSVRVPDGAVATAAGRTFSVDDAVSLIAPHTNLPASETTVRSLANLWIDYTLLATEAAQDTTLTLVDVSGIIGDLVQERLIRELRDSVVRHRMVAPKDVKARYAKEAPNSLVHARQILLAWPPAASPAQKDSVRAAMVAIRKEITEKGVDFATTAKARSQDPATASHGGDLGNISHGQVAGVIADPLFALKTGEVSAPIESGFGVHLLKSEGRATPTTTQFSIMVLNQSASSAESTFVAEVLGQAHPAIVKDAPALVRTYARDPRIALPSGDEAVVTYRNGSVSRSDLLRYLQEQDPWNRGAIAESGDSAASELLMSLAQRKLLAGEVTRRGITVRPEIEKGLATAAASNLAGSARMLSLLPKQGADTAGAVPRAVDSLLARELSGQLRQVPPLGLMAYALRSSLPQWGISDAGVEAAVTQLRQKRGVATP